MTPDVSLLVPATAEALAQGALELLRDKNLAQSLGVQTRKVAEEQYSWNAFLERIDRSIQSLSGTVNSELEQEAPVRDTVSSRVGVISKSALKSCHSKSSKSDIDELMKTHLNSFG